MIFNKCQFCIFSFTISLKMLSNGSINLICTLTFHEILFFIHISDLDFVKVHPVYAEVITSKKIEFEKTRETKDGTKT